jgi:hypothetical protein
MINKYKKARSETGHLSYEKSSHGLRAKEGKSLTHRAAFNTITKHAANKKLMAATSVNQSSVDTSK